VTSVESGSRFHSNSTVTSAACPHAQLTVMLVRPLQILQPCRVQGHDVPCLFMHAWRLLTVPSMRQLRRTSVLGAVPGNSLICSRAELGVLMKTERTLLCALFLLAVAIVTAQHARAQSRLPGHMYTAAGIDLGALNMHDIPESESLVRFTDPQDVKARQAGRVQDRYVEQITLRNNASFTYTRLYSRESFGTNGVGQAAARLKQTVESEFYAAKGIKYDDQTVKRAGELAYFVQSSGTYTCFAFRALLGSPLGKDQDMSGGVCSKQLTPANVEQTMLLILSHARFAESLNSGNFIVSFQIPESLTGTQ
jgi:hypothetical protein